MDKIVNAKDDSYNSPDLFKAKGTIVLAEALDVDLVNRPPHYTQGKIEVIDFIEDQKFGFLAGQVIKYVARYRFKGARKQDLKKAEFYLKRLIARGGYDFGESGE
jgi:hypothetical protein